MRINGLLIKIRFFPRTYRHQLKLYGRGDFILPAGEFYFNGR